MSASLVAEMLEAGASAFVGKSEGPDAVFRAMRTVNAGSVALGPAVARQVADGLRHEAGRVAELETALSEISEQLQSLTMAKADFLANVSHELRTPVTVAKGTAYVLRKRTLPDQEQDRFLGELEMALDRLTGLVEEMVTVAELDGGELTLELTDVTSPPSSVTWPTRWVAGIPTSSSSARSPTASPADPVRLTEIVRQLLDNACRYSSKGGAVNLHGRPMDEGVLVSVTDRGEGVLRETVSRAFEEPFSAGEDILRKERAGAGIGLHLARQLVIGHGGILWVDPLPAGGTRVSFVIPAHTGERVVKPSGLVGPALPPVELPPAPLHEIAAIAQLSTRPTSS
ncbi:MAG: HAMP domain-containing histidine kinase [Actinobacteria bacterium]|nr:HAMP domain-containing histidine kinase [Actinomycetota bacterium]